MSHQPLVYVEGKKYTNTELSDSDVVALAKAGVLTVHHGQTVFRIVGAAAIGKRVVYIIPKYEPEERANLAVGLEYVKILKTYLASGSSRSSLPSNLEHIPTIMQAFEELDRFYASYGIYKERRVVDKLAENKKINWSKTVNRNNAMFSDASEDKIPSYSVIYHTPSSTFTNTYEGIIGKLFRIILTLLATFLSPILRINHPLTMRVPVNIVVEQFNEIFQRTTYYKRLLQVHIAAESGARKRVLKVIYKFLDSDASGLNQIFGDQVFVFGTRKFEYVWEDACIFVAGASRESKVLAQPKYDGEDLFSIADQRIDGVIEPDGENSKFILLDAKYYFPDARTGRISFPVGDVMKQFGYAISSLVNVEKRDLRNVLIFPTNEKTQGQIHVGGSITLLSQTETSKEGDQKISTVFVSPELVFQNYVARNLIDMLRRTLRGVDSVTNDENTCRNAFPVENAFAKHSGIRIYPQRIVDDAMDTMFFDVDKITRISIGGVDFQRFKDVKDYFWNEKLFGNNQLVWILEPIFEETNGKTKVSIPFEELAAIDASYRMLIASSERHLFIIKCSDLKANFSKLKTENKRGDLLKSFYLKIDGSRAFVLPRSNVSPIFEVAPIDES